MALTEMGGWLAQIVDPAPWLQYGAFGILLAVLVGVGVGVRAIAMQVAQMLDRSQAFQEEIVRTSNEALRAQSARWEEMGNRFLAMNERYVKSQEDVATCLERLGDDFREGMTRRESEHGVQVDLLRRLVSLYKRRPHPDETDE